MSDNQVSKMIAEAAKSFEGMINANSVVGEPIKMEDGTIIVPISKLSFGFGGGGSEFGNKGKADTPFGEPLFGGGMGGGASVKAEAFLVINNSNVRLIPVSASSAPLDKLVDLMPGMIDKVNNFIAARSEKRAEKKSAKNTGDSNDYNEG